MWNYENDLFDYLISEVCVSHFSLPFSSLLLFSFCLSVGVGALDLEGDTCPSALGRLSHTASLKRGGSLRTPRSSSERYNHITTHKHTFGAWEEVPLTLTVLLFVFELPSTALWGNPGILRVMRKVAAVCLFTSVTTVNVQTTAVPGSSIFSPAIL